MIPFALYLLTFNERKILKPKTAVTSKAHSCALCNALCITKGQKQYRSMQVEWVCEAGCNYHNPIRQSSNGKTTLRECVYIIVSTQLALVEVCTRNRIKKSSMIDMSGAIYQLESAANLDSAKGAGGTSTAVGGDLLVLDRNELTDDDKFDGRSG